MILKGQDSRFWHWGQSKSTNLERDYKRSSIVQRLSSLVMIFVLYNLEKRKKSEERDTERIQIGTGFGLPLLFVLCITQVSKNRCSWV